MRATKLFVILLVFIAVFLPLVLQFFLAPTGTTYTLGDGYMPDYYQYLSWIKSGQMGQLFLSSRYSAMALPNALVHPIFAITGMVTGLFHISTPVAYLMLRIIATLIFLLMLFRFIQSIFPSRIHRITGLLLFLFGTGLGTVSWSGHFDIIAKYSLPPHHLLALAVWMEIIRSFARAGLAKLIVLGWVLALLNPSIFLFAMIFLAFSNILHSKFWILLLGVSPIIIYNLVTLRSVPPWSIMYLRMLDFNPPTTFINYLLSLSPLLPLSLLGAWKMRNPILISWAYLPIALFPLVGIIPINYSRLLQTYQYIPITLLAVSGLHVFIRPPLAGLALQGVALRKFIGYFLVSVLIIYGAIVYITTLRPQLLPHHLTYYNVFVPNALLSAFRFLDSLPHEQVILSGEYVSEMIPAFTKHRSVIGRDDVIAGYYPLQDRVFAFLDGRMTEDEALAFAKEQKIDYVIFGIDTNRLDDLPTKNYPFLMLKFTDGSVTVAMVDRSLIPR